MPVKHNSLTILMLLIGWVAIQSTALHHEFSAEHLLSKGSHQCSALVGNVEDLDIPQSAPQLLVQAKEMLSDLIEPLTLLIKFRTKSRFARAPPQLT